MKYREENPHLFSAEEGQQSDSMENVSSGNLNFPTTEHPQVLQERRSTREGRASSNNHLNRTSPSVRNLGCDEQGKRIMMNRRGHARQDNSRSSGSERSEGKEWSRRGQEGRRGVVTTSPESSRNPKSRNGNVDDNFVSNKKSLHSPGSSSERPARDLWREQFDCPGEHFCKIDLQVSKYMTLHRNTLTCTGVFEEVVICSHNDCEYSTS